ncbi:MAG: response regulator [Anaerolineales bacterium]|nr:response regulator [Anaerolineales bacterium]
MPKQTEKILVAEGEADVLDLIAQQVLVPLGYPVATAQNGPTALQNALKLQPDIIIAALDLPGLSAFDLLTALRSQKSASLVIVLGPKGSENHMLQAFRLGAKDFLLKPLREAELVTALDRALDELRLRRDREQLAHKLTAANQQLEKRLKELTTLFSIGKAVTAITDLNQLFARLLEGALLVTESDVGWLLLMEEGGSGRLILRATKNVPALAGLKLNQPWDDGLSSLLVLSGEGIHIAGEPLAKMAAGQIAKAAVAVPVKAKDQVMGVLVAGHKAGRPFTDRDQAMLSAVADYASIAMVNARLFQELETRARALQKSYDDLARGGSPEMAARLKEIGGWLLQLRTSLDAVLRGEVGPLTHRQAEALRLITDRLESARRAADSLTTPPTARS